MMSDSDHTTVYLGHRPVSTRSCWPASHDRVCLLLTPVGVCFVKQGRWAQTRTVELKKERDAGFSGSTCAACWTSLSKSVGVLLNMHTHARTPRIHNDIYRTMNYFFIFLISKYYRSMYTFTYPARWLGVVTSKSMLSQI